MWAEGEGREDKGGMRVKERRGGWREKVEGREDEGRKRGKDGGKRRREDGGFKRTDWSCCFLTGIFFLVQINTHVHANPSNPNLYKFLERVKREGEGRERENTYMEEARGRGLWRRPTEEAT